MLSAPSPRSTARPPPHPSGGARPRRRLSRRRTIWPQLEQEIIDEVTASNDKWEAIAEEIETVSIRLEATDVRVTDVRLVWVPVD